MSTRTNKTQLTQSNRIKHNYFEKRKKHVLNLRICPNQFDPIGPELNIGLTHY